MLFHCGYKEMLLRILDSFLVIFRHGTHRQGLLRFVFLEISFKAIKHTFTPPCLFSLSLIFSLSLSLFSLPLSSQTETSHLSPSAAECTYSPGPFCCVTLSLSLYIRAPVPRKKLGSQTHTHTHTHFIIHYSQAVFLFLPWVCSLFDIIWSGLQRAGLHPPPRVRGAWPFVTVVTSAALCWVTLVKLYLQ